MKRNLLACLGFCVVLCSIVAHAGTSCSAPTIAMGDGRITDFDFLGSSGDSFYRVSLLAGRSYSIEVRQNYDDLNAFLQISFFNSVASPCASPIAITDNSSTSDPVFANGVRFSVTPTVSGAYTIQIHNNDGTSGHYFSVGISETTLFNPRFSSFIGFNTAWGLYNTTNTPVTVKLTLFKSADSSGAACNTPFPVSQTFSVAANSVLFTDTRANVPNGLGIANDCAGNAILTHDGPPGAILADAFILNPSFASGPFILPLKFEPLRHASH